MWLLYVTGPAGEAPATFWLPCGTFVVGRKEGKCDILIVNMTVSRQHGLFVVQPQAQSTAMARISFAGASKHFEPASMKLRLACTLRFRETLCTTVRCAVRCRPYLTGCKRLSGNGTCHTYSA